MPDERVQFTLKWPVFRSFDESILDWIFPEIKPFLMVAFAVAQLTVEKIFLPDWLFVRMRPPAGCISTPELNPLVQRRNGHRRGRAKDMQMIRHDSITTYQPMIRLAPRIEQQRHDFSPRQQRTALVHANRDILENGLVYEFSRREMRHPLTAWFASLSLHF